ncbi:MAG: rRNA maturation RNase YbeY [Firmicutes bacterium]|nr:rRNA maturation RNase YbeY [Bacillota bacterium]
MAIIVDNRQGKVVVPAELLLLLEKIGEFILQSEGYPPTSEVSIVLTDNSYIQELNFTYRGLDSPTDVLSFCLRDDVPEQCDDHILGDVVISMERAREQAREYGHSLRRELAFLAVHGMLHLVGYDHETLEAEEVMKKKQDTVLKHFAL